MLLKSKTQIWFVFLTLKLLVFSIYWLLVSKDIIHQRFLLDDLGYLKLYRENEHLWSWKISQIQAIAGGQNSFYYVLIHLAFEYLGRSYFHVVLLNNLIYITVVSFFSRRMKNAELILLLIFPSILLWTTMFNIKMSLVLVLLLITYKAKPNVAGIISILVCLFALANVRFYLAFLVLMSFFLYFIGTNKSSMLLLGLSFGTLLPASLAFIFPSWDFSSLFSDNYFVGIIRFLITPLPWKVEQDYSFLLLSFVFEWYLVLHFIWHLYRQKNITHLDIMILLMIFFYGLVYELQGPRHRVVVEFLMIISIYGRQKAIDASVRNLRRG